MNLLNKNTDEDGYDDDDDDDPLQNENDSRQLEQLPKFNSVLPKPGIVILM